MDEKFDESQFLSADCERAHSYESEHQSRVARLA